MAAPSPEAPPPNIPVSPSPVVLLSKMQSLMVTESERMYIPPPCPEGAPNCPPSPVPVELSSKVLPSKETVASGAMYIPPPCPPMAPLPVPQPELPPVEFARNTVPLISTSEVRITCTIAEDQLEAAATALHAAFELAVPDPLDTGVPTPDPAG